MEPKTVIIQGESDRGNFMSLDSLGYPVRFCLECACVVLPQGKACPKCQTEGCMSKLFLKGTPNQKMIIGQKGGVCEQIEKQADSEGT